MTPVSPSPRLAWGIALVATIAAIAGWGRPVRVRVGHDGEATGGTGTDPAVVAPALGSELAALTACGEALRAERASRHACSPEVASPSARPASVAACLADPLVQARLASEVTRACSADGATAAIDAAARARGETAARSLEGELAITPAEHDQLAHYLCTLRDLRGMLARGADGGVPSALDTIRRERELALHDVEGILGEERYGRLREVGGVGLLGDAIECPR